MGTVVGKVLIMPRGSYDSTVTYNVLDLVSHNGTAWIAKKTATGIEPSLQNSEYWQDMFKTEHTVEQTLTFAEGVAEFVCDLSGMGDCKNVLVTAVGFDHAYCTQIASIEEGEVTIQIRDVTDATYNGNANFVITYFFK